MPKKTKPTKTEPRLPSREDLVAFIANAPGKVGKREIARAFNIQGGDRIWLKQMLKELETDGVVDRRRKGVSKTGQLPPVVVADVTGRDRDGELIAAPEEWDADAHGPAPKISSRCRASRGRASRSRASATACSLRLERLTDDGNHRYAGRVIKIIGKQKSAGARHFPGHPGRAADGSCRSTRRRAARDPDPARRRGRGRGRRPRRRRDPRTAASACPSARCASGSARSTPRRPSA